MKIFLLLAISSIAYGSISSDYESASSYIKKNQFSEKMASAIKVGSKDIPETGDNLDKEKGYYRNSNLIVGSKPDENYVNRYGKSGAIGKLSRDGLDLRNMRKTQENPDPIINTKGIYCSDGKCEPEKKELNTDFGEAITKLSSVSSESDDVRQMVEPNKEIEIFKGRIMRCRDVMIGMRNCCSDHGWAKGLFNCNDEEKDLGRMKEKGGLVVYLGRYCSHHVLGVCTDHKKTYCVFPSRIARDVQVDGRYIQLGKSFGTAKDPDCSGIGVDDINKINLDKVDLSNAVDGEVQKKSIPDASTSQSTIESHVSSLRSEEDFDV